MVVSPAASPCNEHDVLKAFSRLPVRSRDADNREKFKVKDISRGTENGNDPLIIPACTAQRYLMNFGASTLKKLLRNHIVWSDWKRTGLSHGWPSGVTFHCSAISRSNSGPADIRVSAEYESFTSVETKCSVPVLSSAKTAIRRICPSLVACQTGKRSLNLKIFDQLLFL